VEKSTPSALSGTAMLTDDQVDRAFAELRDRFTDPEDRSYVDAHALRYRFLLRELERLLPELEGRPARVLDVGAGFEAPLFRALLGEIDLDTLGFEDDRFAPRRDEAHLQLDLNEAGRFDAEPHAGRYDGVVCAEVIEHLYRTPSQLLRLLHRLLRSGGFLLLQTPNAARLHNRLQLLRGRNPFEPFRETEMNPGHFREYTVDELLQLGRSSGFDVVRWKTANYFRSPSLANRLAVAGDRVTPPRLRAGITVVFRKP
jgi:2-polyprenyl-3-methyl-5-hydroxy-6-metoxy-1,4-benzoquinol methylase